MAYRTPRVDKPAVRPNPLARLIPPPEPPPWLQKPEGLDPWGVPWANYSDAEYAVDWALRSLGLKPYQDYKYQFPLGGGHAAGGQELDFYVFATRIGIRVQGVYWHYERGAGVEDFDQILKTSALADGITIVDIDSDDALRDPVYYTREALLGNDHSRAALGAI